jgi:thiamine pyridinylase
LQPSFFSLSFPPVLELRNPPRRAFGSTCRCSAFIPDAAGDQFRFLRQRIKKEFEAKNPTLELWPKDLDPADDPYTVKSDNPHRIGAWLRSPISDDPAKSGYHLVEADMVVLGELVRQNLIRAWEHEPTLTDWQPAAEDAVRIDGKTYGIPHWLCGDFVFS